MFRSLIVAIAIAAPTIAVAQIRDTTAVPRELVLALLSANSFGDPENLTIGAPPRDFPRELLPESSTLLGGVFLKGERSMTSRQMVVARSNVSPDSALALLERQVGRNGWRAPDVAPMRRGGFVAVAVASYGYGMSKHFCRGDSIVTTHASPRAGGGAYVAISLSSGGRSVCDARATRRRMEFEDDIELPVLRPPSGVRSMGSGSSSSDNYREAAIRLTTTLTPTNLLDHFGEQLKQAGWTISGRLANEDVAVLAANKPDTKGRRMYGTLIATRLGDNEREATFRVVVPEEDR